MTSLHDSATEDEGATALGSGAYDDTVISCAPRQSTEVVQPLYDDIVSTADASVPPPIPPQMFDSL